MLACRVLVVWSVHWGSPAGLGEPIWGHTWALWGGQITAWGEQRRQMTGKGAESQMGGEKWDPRGGRSGPASSVALPLGPCTPHLGAQSFPPRPTPS